MWTFKQDWSGRRAASITRPCGWVSPIPRGQPEPLANPREHKGLAVVTPLGQLSTAGLAPELTRESPKLLCDPHGSPLLPLCPLPPYPLPQAPVPSLRPGPQPEMHVSLSDFIWMHRVPINLASERC